MIGESSGGGGGDGSDSRGGSRSGIRTACSQPSVKLDTT